MSFDVADRLRQGLGEQADETHHLRLSGFLAPAAARRFVRAHLTGVDDDVVETAALLTSEVVTNALLHAGTMMELGITRTDDEVLVTVADGKTALPQVPRQPLTTEELLQTSRGMTVIVALATDFGWLPLPDRPGKVVWFTLRTTGNRAAQAPVPDPVGPVTT